VTTELREAVRFNVNDRVRVRLTDFAHARLLDNHIELRAVSGRDTRYHPPTEDAAGWSTWQLWVLMQQLGPHVRMSGPNLFVDNVIELLP